MRSLVLAMSLLLALVTGLPAAAQAQNKVVNVRGRIVKLADHTLTVRTSTGKTADIMLAPNAAVRALVRKRLSDIKDGDFVGTTTVRGKDGKLHAVEIHYLPPNLPESQSPYDLRPGSMMTNAHVSGIVKAKGGTDIDLTYKGTPTEIVVDRRTAIVGPAPASMGDLKRGRYVVVRASQGADGTWNASTVTVEKNGVRPPM